MKNMEGVDPRDDEAVKAAKLKALEDVGFKGDGLPASRIKRLNIAKKIFNRPETTEYILECYGLAVDEADPLGRIMRRMNDHLMQNDDPRLSMDTGRFLLKTFLPAQVSKSQTQAVVAHVSPPPEYAEEPKMRTRRILPAGQKIAKPLPPVAADDDDEDDDDGEGDEDE
jgi:hypothetical protein